jgi:hypothetical protein
MTDSTGICQSLAGLLEVESADALDWDPSALADWPRLPPSHPAQISPAELRVADFDHAL